MQTQDENLEDDGADADLVLASTRLQFVGQDLLRLNKDGTVVLRISLNSIRSLQAVVEFQPICLIFVLATAAIVAIGWYVSKSDWLSVLLYVLATGVGMLSLFGAFQVRLVITTRDSTVKVDCQENFGEVQGFVASLQQYLPSRW